LEILQRVGAGLISFEINPLAPMQDSKGCFRSRFDKTEQMCYRFINLHCEGKILIQS